MNAILKARWFVFAAWVAVVAVLVTTAPNMVDLVREKGQINVPDGYSSSYASQLLDEMSEQDKSDDGSQVALVFHEKDKLNSTDMEAIQSGIDKLQSEKEKLGITSVVTHFTEKDLKEQLVSKDGKTVLALVSVTANDRSASEISDALYGAIDDVKVDHYYTSSWMIDEDVVMSSQEGLKKTEYITLVFILAVLFIVFRSFVAPLIPLVTVGLSYITAQSIVAFLVDQYNFPLSTFTQIFLVAVLFGIGTDYCILLLSRFKEEMAHHETLSDAIKATYKTAGRTVIYSGLAVMIGFAAIGFSQFKLYQSAAAVAIGVAVLLIALLTLVPFFMIVLGKKIFWPAKGSMEHKQSRLWAAAGTFSLKRPLASLAVVAAITVPFLATYDGDLSFNSLDEIGEKYNSVKAFNVISESFGPGESLPAKIVVKNDEPMNESAYLTTIEKISREVEKVDGVDKVRSATRPVGEELSDLYVSNQVDTLGEGLGKGNDGLKKISGGLAEASTQLSESQPKMKQTTDGIGELINGTNALKSGVNDVTDALSKIEKGIRDGSAGADDLTTGIQQIRTKTQELSKGTATLLEKYKQVEQGLGDLQKGYSGIQANLQGSSQALAGLSGNFTNLEEAYPGINDNGDYEKIKNTVSQVRTGTSELAGVVGKLNGGLAESQKGLQQMNSSLSQVSQGQQALADGLGQIESGLSELENGLDQLADGQGQVTAKMPEFSNGLSKIAGGQEQLKSGFGQLDGQLVQLTDGLDQSVDGIDQVSDGLDSANDYLATLSKTSDKEMTGWFIPEDALANDEFQQVFDNYMSKDRKYMTMDVVLSENPYSQDALAKVDDIEAAVERATKGTNLENADYAISGVTSIYSDLNEISASDYARTVVLMLLGIGIILMIMLRSFIMPLYIIASLILTYYTAMAITETIFVNIMGYSGINWAVPFFAFVILVALGVDYSIFLMDRFNEYKELSVQQAMLEAMRNMGTVIISAVVILGGTFAAMYPSGVLSLLQIATIILSGLLLYAFIILPLFMPVMVKTFGQANWWPFIGERKE
ncbi:efflux RND transporter permease subunit [Fictibacillus iocasae]|uniref:Efflux RND transporter permease subunit n=1 Tax=Fictibacillus iocasae TaxID=2715437 RepID=A0ABW2NV25_9BACL